MLVLAEAEPEAAGKLYSEELRRLAYLYRYGVHRLPNSELVSGSVAYHSSTAECAAIFQLGIHAAAAASARPSDENAVLVNCQPFRWAGDRSAAMRRPVRGLARPPRRRRSARVSMAHRVGK